MHFFSEGNPSRDLAECDGLAKPVDMGAWSGFDVRQCVNVIHHAVEFVDHDPCNSR